MYELKQIVDWQEIFLGLRGAGIELAGVLWALAWDTEPWVTVLVCLFCGAWIIVMFVGLMRFVDGGWLRLFRRYHKCAFRACPTRIRTKYRLCHNHFQAASRYEWEHRDEWAAKDATCDAFYVYILELEGGELYAGQTRNLMRRLDQHRNGKTKTTAGREPNLVWFEQLPSRQAAVEKEADLKHRIDTRPAGVQLMVEEFRRR